jgi:UDP-GlcNAc:undecaprenyl-phosphate GlcNAc-1-phosphate transferase
MFNAQLIIIFPLLVAFIATVIATPLSLIFIKKFGIVDDPKKHKHPAIIHKKPIPRAGGIPLFIGVLIASLIFLPVEKITIAIFIASFICLLTGVLDDKFDISPYLRFVINIVAAVIVVFAGINVPFITNPFGGILFLNSLHVPFLGLIELNFISYAIAIIWIVWVMNMLNWSKGVDGQMPGIVAISAIIIGILSLRFSCLDQYSQLSATSFFYYRRRSFRFFIFNFYPAKIFPGLWRYRNLSSFGGCKYSFRRKIGNSNFSDGSSDDRWCFYHSRRILSGKSPFWHDKKHLHHLLLRFGIWAKTDCVVLLGISAILGALSLSLIEQRKTVCNHNACNFSRRCNSFLHLLTKRIDDKASI